MIIDQIQKSENPWVQMNPLNTLLRGPCYLCVKYIMHSSKGRQQNRIIMPYYEQGELTQNSLLLAKLLKKKLFDSSYNIQLCFLKQKNHLPNHFRGLPQKFQSTGSLISNFKGALAYVLEIHGFKGSQGGRPNDASQLKVKSPLLQEFPLFKIVSLLRQFTV